MILTNHNIALSIADMDFTEIPTVAYLEHDGEIVDFFCHDMQFFEGTEIPLIQVRIDESQLQLPYDWHILIDAGDGSLVWQKISEYPGFPMDAVAMNPFTASGMAKDQIKKFQRLSEIEFGYWYYPQPLETPHAHVIPICNEDSPLCVMLTPTIWREFKNLHLSDIF